MMTLPENPFFTKELRQFMRRRRATEYWLLAGLGLMLLMFVIGCAFTYSMAPPPAASTPAWDSGLLWMLFVPHIILCVGIATYGSRRVFSVEYESSTLLDVLLLPYSTGLWLALKYTFPLVLLFVAWGIGLPFYPIAVLVRMTSWESVHEVVVIPLLFGLGMLLIAALLPPSYIRRWLHGAGQSTELEPKFEADQFLRSFLAIGIMYGCFALWLRGFTPWLQWRTFYIAMVPEGYAWITVSASVLWACVQTVAATVEGNEAAERRAAAFRWSALAVVYYILLGIYWRNLDGWHQWLWTGGFPLVAFAIHFWERRTSRHKHEDPQTQRELAWLAARWDNPVLIGDARTHGRTKSLRRIFIRSVLDSAVLAAIYFLAATRYSFLGLGLMPLLLSSTTNVLSSPSTLMSTRWRLEQKSSVLVQLLITPLTSREILVGRLAAGIIYGWLAHLGGFGIPALALLWLSGLVSPVFAAVTLALCPFALTWNIFVSTVFSRDGSARPPVSFWIFVTAAANFLQIALLIACISLGVVGSRLPPFALWSLAVLLFLLNLIPCRMCFDLHVHKLDQYRSGDILGTEPPTTP